MFERPFADSAGKSFAKGSFSPREARYSVVYKAPMLSSNNMQGPVMGALFSSSFSVEDAHTPLFLYFEDIPFSFESSGSSI